MTTTLTLEKTKMKHQTRPSIESLENKALLSHVGLAPTAVHLGKHAPSENLPATLTDTLTTNQLSYTPGEVVRMTLVETNNTGKNVFVDVGPSIDRFSITYGGKTIWRQFGGFTPDYINRKLLTPGESLTLKASWTSKSVLGAYIAHNQMPPAATVADFSIANKVG
jgi:hypothetical protein